MSDREADVRLRQSLETYRTIFELASDAIFVHDVHSGAILDANRKACEMHGHTLDELRAGGVSLLAHGQPPYDLDHAIAFVREAAAGRPQRFEWLVRRKDGARFWVEVDLHHVHILGEERILASVRNVDERKQAELALSRAYDELEQRVAERTADLERAEQRFRAIVEANPTPLLISRISDGRILYANDRLEALVGAPAGSLLGQLTPDFYFDPTDRPRILTALQNQGFVRDFELRLKRADGDPLWISFSSKVMELGGEPVLATSLIDISERKRTEEALRASEASYRGLFDALTELVYVQDLEGHFLSVNDAVVRAYGYARDEIVGKSPDFLAAPDRVDMEATLEHFRAAATGETRRFDWWGRRKDGTCFPKEIVLQRSTYFGEEVVIAVGRDISERVRAEESLRRSEEHFRRMIENASDLITIMDAEGFIRYQSPAITRLLGYTPAEMTGQLAFDYVAPEDVGPTVERWQRIVEQPGTPVMAEFRFRHKDGSWRYMEGIGTTVSPDSADEGIVVNARDITERKRAEATLRLQKSLLEAQQEASIDGILVVSDDGTIISHNHRFAEMWGIPEEIIAVGDDQAAIGAVLEQVADPAAFVARIEDLYTSRFERARDEIALRDGRVFDRYSAPVVGNDGEYHGRVWFFRDVTSERRYADALEAARTEAERAWQEANRYASSLERELEFGRKIQRGLFPASLPQPDGWELAVRFEPVWHVAGDFYDAFVLPTGRIGLLVADVSGKGVGAALFMALVQSLLRASTERASIARADAEVSDEDILTEAFTRTYDYVGRVHRHAHMFASVFFGLLDPVSGTLRYVNAGHDPPALITGRGDILRLRPTGPAVGLVASADFRIEECTLERGAMLVAYTDGVTEARAESGAFFTEERLIRLLQPPIASAEDLLQHVEEAVHRFTKGAQRVDDITLLAVRRRP